jgi:hypothetical protein
VLLQQRTDITFCVKILFSAQVTTLDAHVNEISEWLLSSRSLVKIRTLSTESVCRRYRLGLKAVSAYRTAQNDFP